MIAPIRLFSPFAMAEQTPAEQAELDRERARLELVLGAIGPYGLADRHARELSGLGLAAAELLQHRLETAVRCAVALEDAEARETDHAQVCGECRRWKLLYRAARIRCCRRAREIARTIDHLTRAYRRAVRRIGGA